ncbi:MAG: type I restriction endonuclease, partial [Fuerstiella sp.]
MSSLDESTIELAALEWFTDLGYQTAHGPDIAPEGSAAERESFSDVLLVGRLQAALAQLNPGIPSEGIDEAFRMVTRMDGPTLIGR